MLCPNLNSTKLTPIQIHIYQEFGACSPQYICCSRAGSRGWILAQAHSTRQVTTSNALNKSKFYITDLPFRIQSYQGSGACSPPYICCTRAGSRGRILAWAHPIRQVNTSNAVSKSKFYKTNPDPDPYLPNFGACSPQNICCSRVGSRGRILAQAHPTRQEDTSNALSKSKCDNLPEGITIISVLNG